MTALLGLDTEQRWLSIGLVAALFGAMALLNESLAVCRELGMRPLVERVLSRRDILEA